MAPKFALFTKGSKLPLIQGFQNRFRVTTVSRKALDMSLSLNNTVKDGKTERKSGSSELPLYPDATEPLIVCRLTDLDSPCLYFQNF